MSKGWLGYDEFEVVHGKNINFLDQCTESNETSAHTCDLVEWKRKSIIRKAWKSTKEPLYALV